MSDIKAVLLDIDDTILPMGDFYDESFAKGLHSLRKIVARAKQTGWPKMGVCSGRERSYCRAVLITIGRPNALSIAENGAFLFNPETEETLPNPALTSVIKDIFQKVYLEKIKKICEDYPEIILYEGNEVNISLELKKGGELTIPRLEEIVKNLLKGASPPNIRSSSIAVDISPPGVDKGSGVKFFSQRSAIPLEQILGIGDSKGDFPMLELVGYAGCPTNPGGKTDLCAAFVKEKGGYSSPFPFVQGAVDVIEHFVPEIKTP